MATIYIDPTVSGTGTGSLADPFQSWASVTWTAGNTYLQKHGTSYASQITVGASGTAAAPITMGAYGAPGNTQAVAYVDISTDATEGIRLSTRSFVTVKDFWVRCSFNNPAASSIGIHVRQACTDILIERCAASGFFYGFLSDNFNLLAFSQTNVLYKSCVADGNWGTGFHCTNACNNITWMECISRYNGFTAASSGGHGFSCIAERQNSFSWSNTSGNIYKAAITLTNPLLRITNVTDGPAELTFNSGAGPGGTLALNQWDKDATDVYVNIGKNPASVTMQAYSNDLYNLIWKNCIGERNIQGVAAEGHGWQVDEGTQNSNLIGCLARNNEYDGFQFARTINVRLTGCVADGNSQAGFRSNSVGKNNLVYNCVSINNGDSGCRVGTLNETPSFKNLITANNLGAGLTLQTGSIADYICSFGNSSADSGGTRTNISTTNPQLDSSYMPRNSAFQSGATFLGGRDFYNKEFSSSPSYGAIQYQPTKSIVNRSITVRSTTTRTIAWRRGITA